MENLCTIVALTNFYYAAQLILGKCRPAVLWTIFGALPVVCTYHWTCTRNFDLFIWIKLYSIMLCICWGTWFRFGKQDQLKWMQSSIALLLLANVAEATVLDLFGTGTAHHLNAASGLILMMCLLSRFPKISIDDQSGKRCLLFNVPITWIIGYTLWNWTFVYLNYPAYLGHHTAVLAAALAVGLIDRKRWVQARAATLGVNLLWMACFPSQLLEFSNTSSWSNPQIETIVAIVSLGWMLQLLAQRAMAACRSERSHVAPGTWKYTMLGIVNRQS